MFSLLLVTLVAAQPQIVGGSFVNVRAAPDANAQVVARLPFGTVVDAGDVQAGFRAIQVGTLRGYISTTLLRAPASKPTAADELFLRPSQPCRPDFSVPNCAFDDHPEVLFEWMDAHCAKRRSPDVCVEALEARRRVEAISAIERRAHFQATAANRIQLWSVLENDYSSLPASVLAALNVWSLPAPKKVKWPGAALGPPPTTTAPKTLANSVKKALQQTRFSSLALPRGVVSEASVDDHALQLTTMQAALSPSWSLAAQHRAPESTPVPIVYVPLDGAPAVQAATSWRWRQSRLHWVAAGVDGLDKHSLVVLSTSTSARQLWRKSRRVFAKAATRGQERSVHTGIDLDDDGNADVIHVRRTSGSETYGTYTETVWRPHLGTWKGEVIVHVSWADV